MKAGVETVMCIHPLVLADEAGLPATCACVPHFPDTKAQGTLSPAVLLKQVLCGWASYEKQRLPSPSAAG